MAASPTAAEQLPSADAHLKSESDTKQDAINSSKENVSDTKAEDTVGRNALTEPTEDNTETAADGTISPPENAEIEPHQQADQGGDEKISFVGLRAAVDEIDENLDDALGQAADSLWSFATTVTGKVSSVVKDQQGLQTLRKNVTSRLTPLGNISRDIQTQIGTLAPNETSIATLTDSVQKVAQTVQRNAVAMEEAILATANDVSDPNTSTTVVDDLVDVSADDPGVAVMRDIQGGRGLDGISKVGESVSNAIEQTVGGLWSGLLGLERNHEYPERTVEMPKTRFGKRIFELQANPDTYCEPTQDLDAFEEWGKDFNLDNYENECIELLHIHDSIADLYERVVPRVVEEDLFWMRYFFAKHNLELEEERRQKLLERAENAVEGGDDEDDGWGDDDWADDGPEEGDDDTMVKESPEKDLPAATVDAPDTAPESLAPQSEEPAETPELDIKAGEKVQEAPKDETLENTSKEAQVKKAQVKNMTTGQDPVQDGDDGWGDDDWE